MSASAHVATNERVAEVTADVIAALHEVLERHQVTEAEWLAALAYLTEVGRHDEFVLLSDVTRTSVLIDALSHQAEDPDVTASDVEGPLYRDDPPWREAPVRIYEDYEGSEDGEVLLKDLLARLIQPDAEYHHRWRKHDYVIWDNRCSNHAAAGGYPIEERRVHWRATIME